MEMNRKAYAEESHQVLRKQQGSLEKLRHDNEVRRQTATELPTLSTAVSSLLFLPPQLPGTEDRARHGNAPSCAAEQSRSTGTAPHTPLLSQTDNKPHTRASPSQKKETLKLRDEADRFSELIEQEKCVAPAVPSLNAALLGPEANRHTHTHTHTRTHAHTHAHLYH